MLERISFELANNRARYTHFIHLDGTIASLSPLEAVCIAKVGVMTEDSFPNELQYDAIEQLAQLAVGINPGLVMEFGEATVPFPARFPADHPATFLLEPLP
jgi:hypothetical protein